MFIYNLRIVFSKNCNKNPNVNPKAQTLIFSILFLILVFSEIYSRISLYSFGLLLIHTVKDKSRAHTNLLLTLTFGLINIFLCDVIGVSDARNQVSNICRYHQSIYTI